jgi:hypothetical protein
MCVGRTAQWVGDVCDRVVFGMFGTLDAADRSRNISGRDKDFVACNLEVDVRQKNSNFILKNISKKIARIYVVANNELRVCMPQWK